MATALANASRGALVKQVETLNRARARQKSEALEVGERVTDLLGSGLAMTTALVVGAAEGRFKNKDQTPLSVGPVSLPVAVGTGLAVGAFITGNRKLSYAASGALAAHGYQYGRAWGAKQLAKSGRSGVSGIGEDWALNDAERELVFGVDTE